MDFVTSRCSQFAHPEFVVSLSDKAKLDPGWLLEFFENAVASGQRFVAQQTVQIGWMVTKLFGDESGRLVIWEPIFRSIPIEWTRGVNNTIQHLLIQKSVASELHVDPVFPSLLQAARVAPDLLAFDNAQELTLIRERPEKNYSGWQIRQGDQQNVESKLISLFELGCQLPRIIPFLALPSSAVAVVSRVRIRLAVAADSADSGKSKFLSDLLKSSFFATLHGS